MQDDSHSSRPEDDADVSQDGDPSCELPKTERDCNVCEDGTLLRDDYELVCDSCSYTPDDRSTPTVSERPEYSIRREAQERAYGDLEGRPRLVGGFPDAYWGKGEYCFHPDHGFQF